MWLAFDEFPGRVSYGALRDLDAINFYIPESGTAMFPQSGGDLFLSNLFLSPQICGNEVYGITHHQPGHAHGSFLALLQLLVCHRGGGGVRGRKSVCHGLGRACKLPARKRRGERHCTAHAEEDRIYVSDSEHWMGVAGSKLGDPASESVCRA